MPKAKFVVSKTPVKSQHVPPREVRERLRVGPGDRVRFLIDPDGVRIEKETTPQDANRDLELRLRRRRCHRRAVSLF